MPALPGSPVLRPRCALVPLLVFQATTSEPGARPPRWRVYGHLGQVRHRAEQVEYRIEAFEDKLKGRLAALRGAV